MIIGLTGKNGAGKGEVAEFLKKRGFHYLSLSDKVRDEMRKSKISPTRESMIKFANELRRKYGAGWLAEEIVKDIDDDKNYVVDSIRSPAEVAVFREKKGSSFCLVAVKADPKVRFERLKKRGREGDPIEYQKFLEFEAMEAKGDPSSQQLDETEKIADVVIENNGTFEELGEEVKKVLLNMSFGRKRPSWDEYFMEIAKVAASRGNCIKRRVAAVIVKDNRVVATGYNGTPRGIKNCDEGGCERCAKWDESGKGLEECICAHAEENAIAQAAYHGVSIKDATLYTTYSPCLRCTKLIINAGIKEVVYNKEYVIEEVPLKLLKEAGVVVRRYG